MNINFVLFQRLIENRNVYPSLENYGYIQLESNYLEKNNKKNIRSRGDRRKQAKVNDITQNFQNQNRFVQKNYRYAPCYGDIIICPV